MQQLDATHYKVLQNERISMEVSVDERPYMASFEEPPRGSTWENVTNTPTAEHREFVAPATFDGAFGEVLPEGSDVDHVNYTIKFRGDTGPPGGTLVIVPKDGGPILETFVFHL